MPVQDSAEYADERPKTKRERRLPKKARKKPKLEAAPRAEAASWWDDSWHWAGLGLTFVASPFAFVSLTCPSWTGAAGAWLAGGLYHGFGISAPLLPLASASLGLHLLLPRSKRPLQLSWAPTLMWLDMVWLSQRMGAQGGALGAAFDGLVVSYVGPMGSWMGASLGLAASALAVCRIPLSSVVRSTARGLVHNLERSLRWAASVQLPTPRLPRRPEWPSQEEEGESVEVAALPAERQTAFPLETAVEPEAPVQKVPKAPRTVVEAKPVSVPEPLGEMEEKVSFAEVPDAVEICLESAESLREADVPLVPWDESQESLEVAEAPESMDSGEALESQEILESVEASDEEEPEEVPVEAQEVEIEAKPAEIYIEPDGQLRLFPGSEKVKTIVYKLPPLALLDEIPLSSSRPQVEDKSQVLLDALASFGVQASLLALVQGPTVTRYELQPARGVKVNRFTSLTNDIALALAAKAVRIEAPIPGKSAIGIEIPNEVTELVVLREILGAPKFRKSTGMSIALGKDLSGTPTFAALQKMPHLLVAGTTGSGKSVCINGLIMSLLYRFTPRELQLLMIDPKQVELSIYEGIPHLISLAKGAGDSKNEGSIICDPKRAALALNQMVELMEFRYGLFASKRVRNLDEYNEHSDDPLPWVVVLIDELADLMMVASKSVETSICRIAQKARAAGIHLVLATQRPSADVITGLIKVNVPSRIAFAVSSQVDSRVILDQGGAEQLLGKGDMLFCPVDASDPRRLQGCFVTNDEISRVVEWWKAQASPDNLIELKVSDVAEDGGDEEEASDDDLLVEQALQVILRRQQASASLLQTELKVGYARARRLIYLMEKKGYIGPAEGSKPRKILAT